ncbi:REP element-mobilizing transposase RayT [Clostridium beijerinckii]|uniref:REP element-mobilizing transposase RayT n=1 Tax=Clostridium beijerinckii TaxID=1520 RepID=A0AAX0B6R7_CLOBE|nr:REP element-mobilizing transposase RayT [Clostridium beijerinckii]NYC70094.1 REP element-mobilizing transposase RayT [Clostridium beijerinckii]
MDIDNLEYSERNGKYHIVFMPRFRKKLYTRR